MCQHSELHLFSLFLESTNDFEENVEEFDWSIEQIPSEEEFGSLNITGQQCGFANNYSFSVFNLKVTIASFYLFNYKYILEFFSQCFNCYEYIILVSIYTEIALPRLVSFLVFTWYKFNAIMHSRTKLLFIYLQSTYEGHLLSKWI